MTRGWKQRRGYKVRHDYGHGARKTVWLAVVALFFVPYVAFYGAGFLAEVMLSFAEDLRRWSHPCLYTRIGDAGNVER